MVYAITSITLLWKQLFSYYDYISFFLVNYFYFCFLGFFLIFFIDFQDSTAGLTPARNSTTGDFLRNILRK